MINMKKKSASFEFITDFTYDIKGVYFRQIMTTKRSWEKRQATLMLNIFGEGVACVAPVIIFKVVFDSKHKQAQPKIGRTGYEKRGVVCTFLK